MKYLPEYPQVYITADLIVFNNGTHVESTFRDIYPRITTHEIGPAKPLAIIIDNDDIMDELTIEVNMSGRCIILTLFRGMMKKGHEHTYPGELMNFPARVNQL